MQSPRRRAPCSDRWRPNGVRWWLEPPSWGRLPPGSRPVLRGARSRAVVWPLLSASAPDTPIMRGSAAAPRERDQQKGTRANMKTGVPEVDQKIAEVAFAAVAKYGPAAVARIAQSTLPSFESSAVENERQRPT